MHRRPIVIANWKMHTALAEAVTLAKRYSQEAERHEDVEVVLLPPSIWLPSVVEALHHRPRNLALGAQNVYPQLEGSFTGEIGIDMIRGFARYVLIGHSERRTLFNEDHDLINQKIQAVLAARMHPVLCVGELTPVMLKSRGRGRPTVVERESDLARQLQSALHGVVERDIEKLVLCYEPLWAVGTNDHVPGAHAAAVLEQLRELVARKYGAPAAHRVRFVYGGSVSADTIGEYTKQPHIDGVLVGRASLNIRTITPIIEALSERTSATIQRLNH